MASTMEPLALLVISVHNYEASLSLLIIIETNFGLETASSMTENC